MANERLSEWTFSEAQLELIPELRAVVEGQVPAEDLEAYFRSQGRWPTVVTVALGVLIAPPVAFLLRSVLGAGILVTIAAVLGLQILLTWCLLGLVLPAVQRRRIRAALRERLLASGMIPCPFCAHDLRGSPEQCPECGARTDDPAPPPDA